MTIELLQPQAAWLRMFLSGALEQMKEQCTAKEAESVEVSMAFGILKSVINQLPENPVEEISE